MPKIGVTVEQLLSKLVTEDIAERIAALAVEKVIKILSDRCSPRLEAFDTQVGLALEASVVLGKRTTQEMCTQMASHLRNEAQGASNQIRAQIVSAFGAGIGTRAFKSAAHESSSLAAANAVRSLRGEFVTLKEELGELAEFFLGAREEARRVVHQVKANLVELRKLKGLADY